MGFSIVRTIQEKTMDREMRRFYDNSIQQLYTDQCSIASQLNKFLTNINSRQFDNQQALKFIQPEAIA